MVEPSRLALHGWSLAYRRIHGGPVPVLLAHGFPCTSLIWDRVVPRLAAAGWDVVAVDLRGYGESDPAPDGWYDLAAFGADLVALARHLGWDRFVIGAHDLGASVAIDLCVRRPDLVAGLLLMNHVIPRGREEFATWSEEEAAARFEYAVQQGHHADELMARLDTDQARRAYVESFYTSRGWCPPDAFDRAALDHLTEPLLDPARLRRSFHDYEVDAGRRPASAPERIDEPVERPVMVLLGPDDATLMPDAVARCEAAYPDLVGPFVVPHSGHFMQWEQPHAVASGLAVFARSLLAP